MRVIIINGPNLNLLGQREPSVYGADSFEAYFATLQRAYPQLELSYFQSNHEGAIVDAIQEAAGRFDGIVINPAASTHTSVAILDALKAVGLPAVEVHVSDPDLREDFRRTSYVRAACIATVKGRGLRGYVEAIDILNRYLCGKPTNPA